MTNAQNQMPVDVLVVEDNAIIAMQLSLMLEELGIGDVRLVATVSDALAALDEKRFDLAILDMQLGEENGLVVAEQCAIGQVPVILSTGFADLLLPVTYATEELLRKPYSMRDLERAITHVTRRSGSHAA